MGSVFERDPVPELRGPQAPAVAAERRNFLRLRGVPPYNTFRPALEEALRSFEVVCADLDRAEAIHITAAVLHRHTTLDEVMDAQGEVVARLLSYFQAGYLVLDTVAAYVIGSYPRSPWHAFAGSLEKPGADPLQQALARILTIRLREARDVLTVHTRGWAAPTMLVGGGSASLSRRPTDRSAIAPDPDLLEGTRKGLAALGFDGVGLPAGMGIAAEVLAGRAADCTPEMQSVYHRLIRRYGLQTMPVSSITPAVLGLMGQLTPRAPTPP